MAPIPHICRCFSHHHFFHEFYHPDQHIPLDAHHSDGHGPDPGSGRVIFSFFRFRILHCPFFSGFVSARIRHLNTIVLSAVGTGVIFIFTGFSHSLSAMRLGIFLAGACSGLYLSSGIAMLTAIIDRKNWGKALGIHEVAPNLSFLLTPVICELLLLWVSWRQILFVLGGCPFCWGGCFRGFPLYRILLARRPG